MNDSSVMILLYASVSVAFIHTLVGVDHYLPFIVIGRSRQWSLQRIISFTALCGAGHVVGSVVLGFVGVAIGLALHKMEWIEGLRGSLAAWGLITFGLIYAAWALVQNYRGHHHIHPHFHSDGSVHTHHHNHRQEHLHPHNLPNTLSQPNKRFTRWSLFLLFAFGPCEALIPLLIVPAAQHNWFLVCGVTLLFSVVTVLTMVGATAIGFYGLSFVRLKAFERYANTLAGLTIAISGLAIQVLGI